MRVIAGKAKGTPLAAPKLASVRPMTDRAKEALFSHLGDRLHQAKVLDLFTGSGSLAIEALSRGASSAVMVDASKSAIRVARDNAIRCGFDNKASFFCDDVWRFVCRLESSYNFDVVFVDPPYAIEDKRIAKLLEDLGSRLRHGATVCLHRERARLGPPRQYVGARSRGAGRRDGSEPRLLPWPARYRVLFERAYGGSVLGVGEITYEGS